MNLDEPVTTSGAERTVNLLSERNSLPYLFEKVLRRTGIPVKRLIFILTGTAVTDVRLRILKRG